MKLRAGNTHDSTYRDIFHGSRCLLTVWNYDSIHHDNDCIDEHCVVSHFLGSMWRDSRFLPTIPKTSTLGRCILAFIPATLPLCPLLLALLNDTDHRPLTLKDLR